MDALEWTLLAFSAIACGLLGAGYVLMKVALKGEQRRQVERRAMEERNRLGDQHLH